MTNEGEQKQDAIRYPGVLGGTPPSYAGTDTWLRPDAPLVVLLSDAIEVSDLQRLAAAQHTRRASLAGVVAALRYAYLSVARGRRVSVEHLSSGEPDGSRVEFVAVTSAMMSDAGVLTITATLSVTAHGTTDVNEPTITGTFELLSVRPGDSRVMFTLVELV